MLHRRGRVHLGMWKCFFFVSMVPTYSEKKPSSGAHPESLEVLLSWAQPGRWVVGSGQGCFPGGICSPARPHCDRFCVSLTEKCLPPACVGGRPGFLQRRQKHFISMFLFLISLHQRPSYCFEWIHVLIWCDQSVIRKTCSLWVEIVSCF